MTSTKNRIFSILLTMLLLFSFCSTAFALNIVDEDLYDYFEYYEDGAWQDLNTVMYTDTADGDVGYCIEHEAKPPRPSVDYVPYDISNLFNNYTLTGIQAILNRGYPADNNGFSDEAAFYATANALRFWIKESCGQGYDFMILSNGRVRAKSGGEAVWDWCLELLQYARNQDVGGSASVYVSPSSPKWTLSNGQLTTSLSVSSSNGYSITASDPNVTISGYTGGRSDRLTVTAPASLSGTSVSLYLTATAGSVHTVDLGFYEPDGSTRQKLVFVEMVSGTTGQSKTVSITGNFYDLTVNKTDASTGSALDGAKFKLTSSGTTIGLTQTAVDKYSAGGSLTEFTTSGGTATITGLPAGSYQLTEVSAPSGYMVGDAKSITLNKNTSVTVANTPAALTILKKDAVSGETLPGATFSLLDNAGNPIAVTSTGDGSYTVNSSGSTTFTTGSDGKAIIRQLPKASYTLREAAMDGYNTLADVAVSFTGANVVTVENQPTVLEFTKIDSVTGEALDGGTFRISDSNGSAMLLSKLEDGVYRKTENGVDTFTTHNGKSIIYGLSAAQYTVSEVSAPDGYTKDADKTVTVSNSGKATVTMADSPMALRFNKTDALSGNFIDGGKFSLYNGEELIKLRKVEDGVYAPAANGSTTFTTHNGSALIAPLAAGSYTISEEQAPDGFAAAADVTANVTESSTSTNPAVASMQDKPLALTVNKASSVTNQPIGGAVFRLYDSRGNAVKVSAMAGHDGWFAVDADDDADFTIPASGSATILYLPQGSYELKEVSAPEGYAISRGTSTAVVGSYNTYTAPASVTVENEPLAMLLDKVDASDKSPLGDVAFRIKDSEGNYLRFTRQVDGSYYVTADGENTFKTNADGLANVLFIPVGTYTLEEQQHPGFAPTEAQEFTVTAENTTSYPAKVGMENWPLYFELEKTDKLSGKALANVPFKLVDSSGNALRYTQQEDGSYKVTASGADTFLTDADGKALISHIPEGSYKLVEQTLDMYATHAEVTVAVTDTNTETTPANVSLENCPAAFKLTKVDAETKAALDNVKFTLKDASGNVVPIALMDDCTYRPAYAVGEDTVAISNATLTTDGNGEIVIHYLKHGTYTLIEQQKAGYAPLKDISFEITAAHSTEAPLAMTVENIPGTLVISKTDAITKAALPGTRFKVLDESGNVIKLVQENGAYHPAKSTETGVNELTVGADGTATVKYITGKVTIRESGAPAGYAYAADATATVGMTAISHENGDAALAMESVEISDQPLALRISKIHAKTLKPLKGAAFEIRSSDGTTPMTFELKDGIYWCSKAGSITTITMDENAQALVCGLPAAKYKLVETVVPNGFFPAPAQDFTIQLTDTYEKPFEITVTNTPEVKLGLDSDKWDDVLLMGGGLLLASAATFIYIRKRRTTR